MEIQETTAALRPRQAARERLEERLGEALVGTFPAASRHAPRRAVGMPRP